jgi:hypothetical protein
MFGWKHRRSEPWSLEGLAEPWGSAPPLYKAMVEHPGIPLPEEDASTRLKWAAGALDGVIGHHMGRADGSDDMKEVLAALQLLMARPSDATLSRLYDAVCEGQVLAYADQLLSEVQRTLSSDRVRLAAVARYFVLTAPRREPVKFGIALLGIAGTEADLDLLRTVGAFDDFTLFAAVAIGNLSPTHERHLWELAKVVEGWGRIQIVERLAQTDDFEIRAWMLREGYRNAVMNEYLACICARAGRLHEALRVSPKDPNLLDSAAGLLAAMITGGPAEDIDDYDHAAEAVEAYLDAAWAQRLFTPKQFVLIDRIREWLSAGEGWEKRSKCGWTPQNRERCRVLSQELLKDEEWRRATLTGLQSADNSVFHWANRAARRLGVDTWDVLFARVEADPLGSTFWWDLTEATDASRIDRLVSFAERVIPLNDIARGPSDEVGLGPGFESHSTLDWMLQLLDRFPGKGWNLIRAGLQSPVVRNRNWSLRVFKNWSREEWPPDAVEVLRTACRAETEEDVRTNLEAFLADHNVAQ